MLRQIPIWVWVRLALFKDRSGATAIEYGLIAAGVSVVIVVTVFALGEQLQATIESVIEALAGADDSGGAAGGTP